MKMTFNRKVYCLCRKIPKGKVTTYKIVAEKLGTKAYRAVGNALNKNPDSTTVPCHRIVGSDGHLTGFARGIRKKKGMLEKEGIKITCFKVMELEKHVFRFDF
ncbi:MGMT family protein [Candidatus Woesearchaeota archaeon]|nr:MGMT family protein [Candidatus Woesearchaeota archaeon]